MSGHKSWSDLKKELGLENYVPDYTPLNELKPGSYWEVEWSVKEKIRHPFRWRLHKKQRIKFGYSVMDWWGFDTYIAGVIAHACERFAEESHGHPADMTHEQWKDFCYSIAEPLKLWASPNRWNLSFEDEWDVLYPKVKEALAKFAADFGCFWD